MKANEGTIVRLLNGEDKRFVVPVYQRPYSWKKSNCKQLIDDLIEVYQKGYKSHFFGSIVYVANDIGGYNEYIIIDGQQRLTTVSLLLLAIRNYIVNNKVSIEGINGSKITNGYLVDQYQNDDKKLKLKLVQGDDEAYNNLIIGSEPVEDNNITVNYRYFYGVITSLSEDELKGIYDAVGKLNVVNVSLNPNDGDDPQMIFESLNSTGMDLDESDKIRNYVLMRLDSKTQEDIYRKYWEVLEKKIGKDYLSEFLRYYIAVKTRELPAEKVLYFRFKSYREDRSDLSIESILIDISKYADYYRIIKDSKKSDKGYKEKIGRLNQLEVNTAIPLLFDLLEANKNGEINETELCKALDLIESFLIRRLVCGLATSPLNKLFVYVGDEIEKYMKSERNVSYLDVFSYSLLTKTRKSRFPTDSEFGDKFSSFELYNAKSGARKLIFESLENLNNKEKVAIDEQLNNKTLSIEHIMPQSLTEEWKKYLGSNWELLYTKYINTIGNLTLTAYNSDYSNLSFDEKLNMPEKGIKYSKLKLNQDIRKTKKWNEKAINDRSSLLLGWAKTIWPYPQSNFEPKIDEEWLGLDEERDYSKMSISKFSLLGDQYTVDSFKDAYIKFNETMYYLDPEKYIGLDKNYIDNQPDSFSEPCSLNENLYFEKDLDNNEIVKRIRTIIERVGFDDMLDEVKILSKTKKRNDIAFDIKNESTYSVITAGNLAYELIKDLALNGRLSEEETLKLCQKEYSRQSFNKVVYPVLAKNRDDNRGESSKIRYYKNPLRINGKTYYVSSQWFDESRDDLIKWYKGHL